MTNNLTDAEVKKALKLCVKNDCSECPIDKVEGEWCETTLVRYALGLINRQEGENAKNENIIRVAHKTIATLNAENESLKAEVERLKVNLNVELDGFASEYDRNIKAEAYKEFAERLKDESEHFELEKENFVSENQINNLLNELVGD